MKAGELYRYPKDAGKWCRHGLRLIHTGWNGVLYAIDTYWDDFSNGDPIRVDEIEPSGLEFILDLNTAKKVTRDVWERYAEKDRAHIPDGGCGEQFWVRKDAEKCRSKEREWLERCRDSAKADVRVAQGRVEWYEQQLAELEGKDV